MLFSRSSLSGEQEEEEGQGERGERSQPSNSFNQPLANPSEKIEV